MVKSSETVPTTDECSITNGSLEKPDWLTPEFFHEYLKNDIPNFVRIKKMFIKSAVPTGENFMTIILRAVLEVEMKDGQIKPTSYMVKIRPKTDEMKHLVSEWHIFEKEQITYSKYIPAFEELYLQAGLKIKFAPKCFEVREKDLSKEVLLLEDLRLHGFKNANRLECLDMKHTEATLKKLAQFHAASAHYVQLNEEFPRIYEQCFASDKDYLVEYRADTSKLFRDNFEIYGDFHYLNDKIVSI